MEVKILCECGVKFKFDVEPVNGCCPAPVRCPACQRDQIAAANEIIGHALATTPVAVPATGPKLVKMEAPAVGTVLSVAGKAKEEGAVSAPAIPVAAHPAAGRVSAPQPRERVRLGMGVVGAIIGALVGGAIWYFLAIKVISLWLLGIIPGVTTGFAARWLARGNSDQVALTAVAIAAITLFVTPFAIVSTLNERALNAAVGFRYQERLILAKDAVKAKTDEQVREIMINDENSDAVDADQISEEAVAAYRRKELVELQKFARGEPTRARFEQEERERITGGKDWEEHKISVRWFGLLIWGSLGLSAAYKWAGGKEEF